MTQRGQEAVASSRMLGLDLLRGVAVALVILQHTLEGHGVEAYVPGLGITGVVIFFALSGYLITGVLHRDISRNGRIGYRHFYRNRALRLLPALAVVITVYVLVESLTDRLGGKADVWKSAGIGMFYVADVPQFTKYLHGLGHLWTLAVEEQFYLVWPIVLFAFTRWGRERSAVLGALTLSAMLTLVSGIAFSGRGAALYPLPTTWAPALLAGSAAYLLADQLRPRFAKFGTAHVAAIGWLIAAPFLLGISANLTYLTGALLTGLASAILIVWLSGLSGDHRLLAPLLGLGTISYAAYLWNYPITHWINGENAPSTVSSLAGAVGTVLAASLSWFALEKPINNWKRRLDRQKDAAEAKP